MIGGNPHSLTIPRKTAFDAVILADHAAGMSREEMANKYDTTLEGLMVHLRRVGIEPALPAAQPVEEVEAEKVVPMAAPVGVSPKVKRPSPPPSKPPVQSRDAYFEKAKFTPSDDVIREDRLSGLSTYAMAAKYGVSQPIVHRHLMRLGMAGTKDRPKAQVARTVPEPTTHPIVIPETAAPAPRRPAMEPDLAQLVMIARLMREADVDAETAVSILIAARAL